MGVGAYSVYFFQRAESPHAKLDRQSLNKEE